MIRSPRESRLWIVGLADEDIERLIDPSGDTYRGLKQARRGEKFESASLPELALGVDAMLG